MLAVWNIQFQALVLDVTVIPLLVRGASMPSEKELPASLMKLAFRNGTQIRSDPDFHRDMDRVIAALKGYVLSKRQFVLFRANKFFQGT